MPPFASLTGGAADGVPVRCLFMYRGQAPCLMYAARWHGLKVSAHAVRGGNFPRAMRGELPNFAMCNLKCIHCFIVHWFEIFKCFGSLPAGEEASRMWLIVSESRPY